jgi:hypothetical protein
MLLLQVLPQPVTLQALPLLKQVSLQLKPLLLPPVLLLHPLWH